MVPGYDCAASVLLCAEDNASILGLDEEGEESSWAAATPPRDTIAAAADGGGWIAADGFFTEFLLQSDDYVAALVERETAHMPAEGYPQKLQRRYGDLDLAALRRDAVDRIWKVTEHYNFAPLTAVLSVNYLDRFLSTFELPEGRPWMAQLLAVSCLSLASKMEETFVPLPLDLQVLEKNFVFEGRTLKRMELLVLGTLKWRMHAVTACSFIEYFLHKLSDLGAPSLLARSRSSDLILNTAKGAEFAVFRPSEVAASVALAAMGEYRSSVIERAAASCKYLNKVTISQLNVPIKPLDVYH
ncbi:hypothetical protein HU200_017317 [Digitaria exilis]|uniref:Cyclin-like domain-containing protein n=1 Tax=Digitaria exilis TaxID=1010633 RepID=A0A835F6L2_9POAL|nr:hypothetical protein HU200_017317 [Digitaria exilis]